MKKHIILKMFVLVFILIVSVFQLFPQNSFATSLWGQTSDHRAWRSIASDSTGAKLVAAVRNGYIYTSSDSGVTWTANETETGAGTHNWYTVASSSDGSVLVAGINGGYIYTSTDSGDTWTTNETETGAGSHDWYSVASSSDGSILVAAANGGYIYTSSDSGATWTTNETETGAGSHSWTSVASSSNGSKLVAAENTDLSGYIYTSSDSGATWTQQTVAGKRYWMSVASSSDGIKLVATVYSGFVYTSPDSGVTWTTNGESSGTHHWFPLSSSSDGSVLAAGDILNGYIYTSIDGGLNWVIQTSAGVHNWMSIASSSDGSKLVAVEGSYIYNYGYSTLASVTTLSQSAVTSTTATLNGNIADIGGDSPTIRGFEYGKTSSYGTNVEETGGPYGEGDFSANISGLDSDTQYLYRAYVTNSFGTRYGSSRSFITEFQNSSRESTAIWTQQDNTGPYDWFDVSSSSDGVQVIAAVYGGDFVGSGSYIYKSTNGGATWTALTIAGKREWSATASSSDGTKLAAVDYGGFIYTSPDSGATWTTNGESSEARRWYSIASSSDGSKLAAVDYGSGSGGYIYTSTNSGVAWVERTVAGKRDWMSISSSSDGIKLAAAALDGYIYTSSDSGASWTTNTTGTGAGSHRWSSVASDSTGTNLVATENTGLSGYIYTSSDSGSTWTQQTIAGKRNWMSVASSSDGSQIAAAQEYGYVYTSLDSGASWIKEEIGSGSHYFNGLSYNSDGSRLVAVGDYVYIFADVPTSTPLASFVAISGTHNIDKTLTGTYTYNYEDPEVSSTFKWYRDDIEISGETSITYVVLPSDLGKTIKFEVTPSSGITTGDPVKSAGVLIVNPPSGSSLPPAPNLLENYAPLLTSLPSTIGLSPSKSSSIKSLKKEKTKLDEKKEIEKPKQINDTINNEANNIKSNSSSSGSYQVFNPLPQSLQDNLNGITQIVQGNLTSTSKAIKEARDVTAKTIELPAVDTTVKVVAGTGVVSGVSISASSILSVDAISFSEFFLIPVRLWGLFLTALGIRKRNKPWGTVYDSVTKQPIDPAYVVAQDLEGKEVATSITDLDGRYGFLISPGRYRLLAHKTNYEFPSSKLAGKNTDEIYTDLYFDDILEVTSDKSVIAKNIPMDPLKFDWNEFAKKDQNLMKFYSQRDIWLNKIGRILFYLGFLITLIAVLTTPNVYNVIVFAIYVIFYVFKHLVIKPRPNGTIKEKGTGIPLSFAVLRVYTEDMSREIIHRIANKTGRFYCLVPNGTYSVKIEKKNRDESYTEVYQEEKIIVKNGFINNNFVLY